MFQLFRQYHRFGTGNIEIKNYFNHSVFSTVSASTQQQLHSTLKLFKQQRHIWKKVAPTTKIRIYSEFLKAFEANKAEISAIQSTTTGKQWQECLYEAKIAELVLRNQLLELVHPVKHIVKSNYYILQPFEIVAIFFDNSLPLLSISKYLGHTLRNGNALILRPQLESIPLSSLIVDLWNQASGNTLIVESLRDSSFLLDNPSLTSILLNNSDLGFVSFSGSGSLGGQFYHTMAKKNQCFAESDFLLKSSDAAYIFNDLAQEELLKVAKVLARGSFSNSGRNFNSIKRIYIDESAAETFVTAFKQAAAFYTFSNSKLAIDDKGKTINTNMLAPQSNEGHLNTFRESICRLKALENQFQIVKEGALQQHLSLQNNNKFYVITPTICIVQATVPSFPFQDQQLPFPICFISKVSSYNEAITRINASNYGVTASIFCKDIKLAEDMGKYLQVGVVNINTWDLNPYICYSPRKASGKGFSFSAEAYQNIVRSKAVSY